MSRITQLRPQHASLEALARAFIREEVREAISEAMADHDPGAAPALVDRAGLGRRLTLSVPVVDALRKEPGFPCVWVTADAPRFRVDAVVAWLENRGAK